MKRAEALGALLALLRLAPAQRYAAMLALPAPARRALEDEWWWQAHGGQLEPAAAPTGDPWRVWAIVAGRGFGKTRAGAEWVWARAREHPAARIALVAASFDEVARVMVKGESGLLALARGGERPRWVATRGILHFPSGAEAHVFSAERPDKLRGPQHHFAWCDELAKWPRADATWNNLMLGLRLGEAPRTIVTTTPKPVPLLRRILAFPSTARTEGRTHDNPHLPPDFIAAMREQFAGTRLARQELEGLLLEDHEGALWTRELVEKARAPQILPCEGRGTAAEGGGGGVSALAEDLRHPRPVQPLTPLHHAPHGPPPLHGEDFRGPTHATAEPAEARPIAPDEFPLTPAQSTTLRRVVIGLDPPASTGGDSCGIVVCGKDGDGVAYVLADLTARGLSPEAWARRVAEAAALFGASRIVAEKNQGGDMIASVLRAVDADLPVKLVAATRSKAARAADRAEVRDGPREARRPFPRAGRPALRADLGGVHGRGESGPA